MNDIVKKDISKFKKNFGINYMPKFGYCPAVIKTNIMEFYQISFEEALEVFTELSHYISALVRFNDYLFENIEAYKTIDLKINKN